MSPSFSRVVIVGGGPGGLLLASLLGRSVPEAEITVFERNRRTDAFGFGVVFSDATLRAVDAADPTLRKALDEAGTHWDRIEVWSRGERHGFSGNGMSAIHRKELLRRLQASADDAGVEVRYGTVAPPLAQLRSAYDIVVGADGSNSAIRTQLEAEAPLGHTVETATAKFIWFATTHIFDGLTFVHRQGEHGNFAAHAYPISDELSTFIVETDEDTWRRAGLDAFDVTQPPGPSDEHTQAYLEQLFADDLSGGHLVANNSRWSNFRTRRSQRWGHGNVVLLGDAVHTAHFSVGSGTKMAMEDAVELSSQLTAAAHGDKDVPQALIDFVARAEIPVAKVQRAAVPSLSWWEHFGTYQRTLDPVTFAFHFFSRSINIDKIARRDPSFAREARDHWTQEHGADVAASPIRIGDVDLGGRYLSLAREGTVALRDGSGSSVSAPSVVVPGDASISDVPAMAGGLPAGGPVVIEGPRILPRLLLAEEARLHRGLQVVLAGPDLADPAAAETAVLSGRADAVAVR